MCTSAYKEIIDAIEILPIIEGRFDHRDVLDIDVPLYHLFDARSGLCIGKRDQNPIDMLWIGVERENGLGGEVFRSIDHESIGADGGNEIMFIKLVRWEEIAVDKLLLERTGQLLFDASNCLFVLCIGMLILCKGDLILLKIESGLLPGVQSV